MRSLDYASLSDEELIDGFGAQYDKYVKMQSEHVESLASRFYVDINSFDFKIRDDYLSKAVDTYKELVHELQLEPNSKDTVNIGIATVVCNFSYLCSYIRSQITNLSAFAAIMKGVVGSSGGVCYNTYSFAINHAKELGLGFDRYEFLYCEYGLFNENVTANQIVNVLNMINNSIKKLVTRYVSGSTSVGWLNSDKKQKYYEIISEPELVVRMCIYYNRHNPIVSFVNNDIRRFILCK